MKKIIYFSIITTMVIITASCSTPNKTEENSTPVDTSTYMEQPKDNTNMRDTMNTAPMDSSGFKRDSV